MNGWMDGGYVCKSKRREGEGRARYDEQARFTDKQASHDSPTRRRDQEPYLADASRLQRQPIERMAPGRGTASEWPLDKAQVMR